MNRIFYTSDSEKVRTGHKIGVGGEGEVYEIQDKSDLVAKIYHEPPPAEKAQKLIALSRLGTERLFKISAWPVDVLRAGPNGNVVGFVMKKICQAEEVHTLHSPKSRLQKFPEASWTFLIYVAANIVRTIATIHEHGFVIGDVNPKNILVTKKATVFLLDCDSFQVTTDGKTYRCEGGFPEYTPPELHGRLFREVDRKQEHDYFGLAVVIFQLLFLGRHPFSGLYLGAGEMTLERAIKERRFAFGADSEARKMRQPPGTIALEAVSAPLSNLFRKAFLSTTSADRPRPRDWIGPLESLTKSLRECSLHNGHHYYRGLSACPWCSIENSARVRLFNFMLGKAGQERGYFRLDDIWRGIAAIAIQPPEAQSMPQEIMIPPVTPSQEVAPFADRRHKSLIYSIIFSVVAGWMIPWFTDFPFTIWFMMMAIFIARALARADFSLRSSVQTIFQGQSIPNDPLVEKIEINKEKAEITFRELEARWNKEASNERFNSKVSELHNRKETYERIPQIREWKLRQLAAKSRADQLNRYLDRFEIQSAEINGIGNYVKASLLTYGIETAADVNKQLLQQIPTVGEARAEWLQRWRQDIERQFVFNPGEAVSPQARITVEKEIDDLRLRLEHELSSGAFYLRRVKQEIEETRRQLLPALLKARYSFAQAEKDWEGAIKRNSLKPAVFLLIIAFLFASFMELGKGGTKQQARPPQHVESYQANEMYPKEYSARALDLYSEGQRLSMDGKFEDAVPFLRQAVILDSRLREAHEELGYVLYQLERYEESIGASRRAASLKSDFRPYYNLGLAYIKLENWSGAKEALTTAVYYCRNPWMESYSQAYYNLALSLSKLGEAERTIRAKEIYVREHPQVNHERFELANLYLFVGNYQAAWAQYRILKQRNPILAEELAKLIKRHDSGKQFSLSFPLTL